VPRLVALLAYLVLFVVVIKLVKILLGKVFLIHNSQRNNNLGHLQVPHQLYQLLQILKPVSFIPKLN
jgi:hypothetical protein